MLAICRRDRDAGGAVSGPAVRLSGSSQSGESARRCLASLGRAGHANVHLIEPLEYLPFVLLMSRAELILSDSGGVQEEAPSLGARVIVMRDVTERAEGIETGLVRLAGTERERIVQLCRRRLVRRLAAAAPGPRHLRRRPGVRTHRRCDPRAPRRLNGVRSFHARPRGVLFLASCALSAGHPDRPVAVASAV